jgi:hypothetical protein
MKRIIFYFILLTLLISCDQLNIAYLKNSSGQSIRVYLYFLSYNPSDVNSSQNLFIKYLIQDSAIQANVKLTLIKKNIARVDFSLSNNTNIELIYDTAPLRENDLNFSILKQYSGNFL